MNEQFNRRKFLVSVGFGSATLMTAGVAANAQTKLQLPSNLLKIDPKLGNMDPKLLELKLADPRAIQALRLTNRLPGDTPILEMGLTREASSLLTPGARKLTKADLEGLSAGKVSKTAAGLSVADIELVKVAFGSGYRTPGSVATDISCCCCTPCCCAAAVDAEAA